MANLIVFVVLALIVWAYFKYIHTPKYRVALTDPVTGYKKYLSSVDGINNTFQYSASADGSLIFKDVRRAERFASSAPQDANPIIERKNFFFWVAQQEG